MQRHYRVVIAKPGLDGHDRGAKVIARALRDAGFEVIYTGLHQTPDQIAEAALQEDADAVGLSLLSGAHMTLFPGILQLMRERGIGDRLLTGGGIIPNDDMTALLGQGVGKLFGPGTNTQDIVHYIREWYAGVHGAAALPPLPPPPAKPAPVVGSGARPVPVAAKPVAKAAPLKSAAPAKKTPAKKAAAKPAPKKVTKKAAKKVAKKTAKPAPKKTAKKVAKKATKKSAKTSARR